MITIEIDTKKIDRFLMNLETNIHKEGGKLVYDIVKDTKRMAKSYAPVFDGELRDSIYRKTNKKTMKGKVYVKGSAQILNEARLNELGPRSGHTSYYPSPISIYVNKFPIDNLTATRKLRKWMMQKGRKSITLGGPNTRWGKASNKFMAPAFKHAVKQVPSFAVKAIERACKRSIV